MRFDGARLSAAEAPILAAPLANPIIPGLRGARKARIARPGTGKRGGGRVVYYIMFETGVAAFLLAYRKNEKDDLTQDDRKAILRAIELLRSGGNV
jgi:hypothetical protein